MRTTSRIGTFLLSLGLATTAGPAYAGERDVSWERTEIAALGGPSGRVGAIDGDLLVGRADVPAPPGEISPWVDRAFVADLSEDSPAMVDLGTLGGYASAAYDVDDGLVVGKAETAEGVNHAFFIDLSSPDPEMVDMGTLGGRSSAAFEVEGRIIVGVSDSAEGRRPFRYDVDAAQPRMEELPLGDRWRRASVVDLEDGIVVGDVRRPGARHAYAVDLNARKPRFRDLGTLGGRTFVTDLGGGLVVGKSIPKGKRFPRAFQVDLTDARPRMQKVAADWGRYGEAQVTDGRWVVGVRSKKRKDRLFAFKSHAPRRTLRDIGTEGSNYRATALDGRRYVGAYYRKGHQLLMYGDLRWRDPAPIGVSGIGGEGLPVATIRNGRVVAPTVALTLWEPAR